MEFYRRITNSKFLLNILSSDYKIQFPITLHQSKHIFSVPSSLDSEFIKTQILDQLESGVISKFPSVEGQHFYRVFTVKCPMVNLQIANLILEWKSMNTSKISL